jgi:hypothetical protein
LVLAMSDACVGFDAVRLWQCCLVEQVCNDVERARKVLQQGLASAAAVGDKLLWEGAIFFEETVAGEDRVPRVLALYDKLLATQPPNDHTSSSGDDAETAAAQAASKQAGTPAGQVDVAAAKDASDIPQSGFNVDVLEEFSKRCVEFADMYADIATLRRVQQRHCTLFKLPSTAMQAGGASAAGTADASRKRAADTPAANGPVAKAARFDAAASGPAAAAAAAAPAMHVDAGGYYPPPPTAGAYGGHWQAPPYGYGHPTYGGPHSYGYGYDSRGYDRSYERGYGGY